MTALRVHLARRRLRQIIVAVAVIAWIVFAFVFVLPRVASYGAVLAAIGDLTWPWIAALVLVTAANLVTFAPPWMVTLPGLGFWRALSMTQVSTAFGLVMPGGAPVGMAASFAALRTWGFARRPVGLAVTLTGLWNQLSVFVFPVVAVMLLAAQGGVSSNLAFVAVAGVVLFVAVTAGVSALLSRPAFAFRAGELARRFVTRINSVRRRPAPSWDGEAVVRLRSESLVLLRRRWVSLTVATLANQLTGYLMLEFSVRAVGISLSQVSVAECFAAWSIGRLLISLPLTPGGIGIVELGLSGTLIGFGGSDAKVVAGVLLYRALSIAPTLLVGMLALATWKLQAPRRDTPLGPLTALAHASTPLDVPPAAPRAAAGGADPPSTHGRSHR